MPILSPKTLVWAQLGGGGVMLSGSFPQLAVASSADEWNVGSFLLGLVP